MRKALICGISGQDGSYLAQFLLQKGYSVVGASRDIQTASFNNLDRLKIRSAVELSSMILTDFRSVLQNLKNVSPDEVYNLAGQSSVGLSFEQPVETLDSIAMGTLNLLEAIRFLDRPIRLYNACSSECFGNTRMAADENTAFRPRSPYAVAKAAAFWEVANYREAYGLFSCSGILFNHESSLRPERFVTQKIVRSACRIKNGSREKLRLAHLDISRDWGWAPDFVQGMHAILQQSQPEDFVLATGEVHSLQEFVAETFNQLGLSYQEHLEIEPRLRRPLDLEINFGNYQKAEKQLGWKPTRKFKQVIQGMIEGALEKRG